jgi:hypothetical protein
MRLTLPGYFLRLPALAIAIATSDCTERRTGGDVQQVGGGAL